MYQHKSIDQITMSLEEDLIVIKMETTAISGDSLEEDDDDLDDGKITIDVLEIISSVTVPPEKQDVSKVVCKLVDGIGTREEALASLKTMASWINSKAEYSVRTMGYFKTYAAIPLLLDFIEHHMSLDTYDEECIHSAAHVMVELTYAGKDGVKTGRAKIVDELASSIIEQKGVMTMIQAIYLGIAYKPESLSPAVVTLW